MKLPPAKKSSQPVEKKNCLGVRILTAFCQLLDKSVTSLDKSVNLFEHQILIYTVESLY